MPLMQSASKKALKKNIETEMRANPDKKDRAQNLAIAYSVQRRNRKHKMAEGGRIDADSQDNKEMQMMDHYPEHQDLPSLDESKKHLHDHKIPHDMDESDALAEEILAKHKKMIADDEIHDSLYLADGGMIDEDDRDEALKLEAKTQPMLMQNKYNYEAHDEEIGDMDALDHGYPKDDDQHSDDEHDELVRDTARRMRAKMRK